LLFIAYLLGRSWQAHALMLQSALAFNEDNVGLAYELQQRAVELNPYQDSFRRRYAGTSMMIATALSNKADITEFESQQVSALIEQAVREARAATVLDEKDFQNWLSLAGIYTQMVPISEEALNWAVQSYVSAVQNNPNDPVIRLELAELFMGAENYNQAINIYNQAVELKPDLPVSYFNLGMALERIAATLPLEQQAQILREARLSFQTTLVLLDPISEEYTIVTQKIEEIETYMSENNMSLEPEEGEVDQAVDYGDGDTQLAPSLIDQNLDPNVVEPRSDIIGTGSQDIESNDVNLDEENENL
jgi:tetratricopeptide (TPR) repeat protein